MHGVINSTELSLFLLGSSGSFACIDCISALENVQAAWNLKLFWLEVLRDRHCRSTHSDWDVIFQREGKMTEIISVSTEIVIIDNCVLFLRE